MLAFVPYGPAHWIGLTVTVLGIVVMIVFRKPLRDPVANRRVGYLLAGVLLANEISFQIFEINSGRWSIQNSLRIHLCELGIYLLIYVLVTRRPLPFQVAYYWITSGMVHGMITPDLEPHEPAYAIVDFFVYHGLPLVALAFLLATTSLRPTWRGIWAAVFVGMCLLPFVALFDWVTGANYWFLCEKPYGDNLTSILPEWPWYVVCFVPLAIAHYLVAYAPFALVRSRDA